MGSARLRFLTLCGGEETMKKEKGKLGNLPWGGRRRHSCGLCSGVGEALESFNGGVEGGAREGVL
jgi:hypothetical protein